MVYLGIGAAALAGLVAVWKAVSTFAVNSPRRPRDTPAPSAPTVTSISGELGGVPGTPLASAGRGNRGGATENTRPGTLEALAALPRTATVLLAALPRPRHVASAQTYFDLVEDEILRATDGIELAQQLRRQGALGAATNALVDETLRHARQTVRLHRLVGSDHRAGWLTLIGPLDDRNAQHWYNHRKQALLKVKVPPADRRLPSLKGLWYALTGGPRTGAYEALYQVHLAAWRRYTGLRKAAKRYVDQGLEQQARAALGGELDYQLQRSFRPGEPVETF